MAKLHKRLGDLFLLKKVAKAAEHLITELSEMGLNVCRKKIAKRVSEIEVQFLCIVPLIGMILGCSGNLLKGRFTSISQPDQEIAEALPAEPVSSVGARHEVSDLGILGQPKQLALLDERAYRLTADELLQSINHAFQLQGAHAISQKPWSDPEVGGFKNRRSYLHMGRAEMEALLDFASTASQRVFESFNERFQKLENPQAQLDLSKPAKCFDDFSCLVKELAPAFEVLRTRPLQQPESVELEKTFVQVRASSSSAEAFRFLVLNAIVDPELIYMQEGPITQSDAKLENRLLARRISYALTGLPPDASLRKLAARNDKVKTEEWKTEVARIVKTDLAAEQFTKFVRDWLDLKPLTSVKPQPPISSELATALDSDFDFTLRNLFSRGSFSELLSGQTAWMSALSASHYGVVWQDSSQRESSGRQNMNLGSARRGIVSLAPFLASHADTHDSHPVRRGRMIRERLLCKAIEPPNENIPLENPVGNANETLRERFGRHSKEEACASCHKYMDSLGFSLENFDQSGIFRKLQKGIAIDTSGKLEFTNTSDTEFEAWADLAVALSKGADTKRCFLQNYISYIADEDLSVTLGDGPSSSATPLINSLQSLLSSESGSLQEITAQIVTSPIVLNRVSKEEKP